MVLRVDLQFIHNYELVACGEIWLPRDRPMNTGWPSLLAQNTILMYLTVNGQKEQHTKTNDWKSSSTGVILYYTFAPLHLPVKRIVEGRVSVTCLLLL